MTLPVVLRKSASQKQLSTAIVEMNNRYKNIE